MVSRCSSCCLSLGRVSVSVTALEHDHMTVVDGRAINLEEAGGTYGNPASVNARILTDRVDRSDVVTGRHPMNVFHAW